MECQYQNTRILEELHLTHWGHVTHICVDTLTIIGYDNGLSPGRHQAIIWTNAGILLTGPLGTNFSENLIEIHTFSFKKMHLKMPSGKWRPFCLSFNVLRITVKFVCKFIVTGKHYLSINSQQIPMGTLYQRPLIERKLMYMPPIFKYTMVISLTNKSEISFNNWIRNYIFHSIPKIYILNDQLVSNGWWYMTDTILITCLLCMHNRYKFIGCCLQSMAKVSCWHHKKWLFMLCNDTIFAMIYEGCIKEIDHHHIHF